MRNKAKKQIVDEILFEAQHQIKLRVGLDVRVQAYPFQVENDTKEEVLDEAMLKLVAVWKVSLDYITQETKKDEPVFMRKICVMYLVKLYPAITLLSVAIATGMKSAQCAKHALQSGRDLLSTEYPRFMHLYNKVKNLFDEIETI